MPIAALPETTIHLLGSAQCLTTPTSLVKELIDNGLDAKATSLDILVSQNTLDKIQVRDNGHGIPHEDLDALGKRGHTSKLRSFEELKSIGGTSLGFRGEALASAVQLGEVSLTTRVDGEPVATTVVLKAPGGIDRQSRTSHPIGTTVCVTKFMSKLPVRKQTALKSASRTLLKIRELVHAYALARPSVRFSLKVVNESKSGWLFALRPNDGIKEAVSEVIGRTASMQCMHQTLAFPKIQPGQSTTVSNAAGNSHKKPGFDSQFQFDVFLPKPDAEPSKLGQNQYLSIDGRPVSHEKGTMKRIVTMFKSYIRGAFGDESKLKNPFIRFDIKCPKASYDPNVEPAKDDVLFANETLILESIEGVFKKVYGEIKAAPSSTRKSVQPQRLNNPGLLYARNPTMPLVPLRLSTPPENEPPPVPISEGQATTEVSVSSVVDDSINELESTISSVGHSADETTNTTRRWVFDMSNNFSEDVEGCRRGHHTQISQIPSPGCIESRPTESDKVLNPWVIAKMTAPIEYNSQHSPIQMHSGSHGQPQRQKPISIPMQQELPSFVTCGPSGFNDMQRQESTDAASSDPPFVVESTSSLQRRPPRRGGRSKDDIALFEGSIGAGPFHQRRASDGSRGAELRSNFRSPALCGWEDSLFVGEEDLPRHPRRANDFISARKAAENHLISPPPTLPQSYKTNKGLQKSFVVPWKVGNNPAPTDKLRQTTIGVALQSSQIEIDDCPTRSRREPDPDLEWAMEFEERKKHASHQRRQELRGIRDATFRVEEVNNKIRPSPHKNRYNAAITALESDRSVSQNSLQPHKPLKTSLQRNDPRAYLMEQQTFMAAQSGPSKLTRAKSMKLPLETIPKGSKTHAIVLTLSTDVSQVRKITNVVAIADKYITHGAYDSAFENMPSDIPELTTRIQAVAEMWINSEKRNTCEVEYMFENISTDMPICMA